MDFSKMRPMTEAERQDPDTTTVALKRSATYTDEEMTFLSQHHLTEEGKESLMEFDESHAEDTIESAIENLELAMEALKSGDREKAIELFGEVEDHIRVARGFCENIDEVKDSTDVASVTHIILDRHHLQSYLEQGLIISKQSA